MTHVIYYFPTHLSSYIAHLDSCPFIHPDDEEWRRYRLTPPGRYRTLTPPSPPRRHRSPSPFNMVVDPIPASGPALKPPPTIPAFISQQKQQSSETFKEAQAKEWDSKIKSISSIHHLKHHSCLVLRNIMSLLHAREQLVSFERSNTISARFVGTTPESIAKIKGLKQEIETLHTKLAESDSWPPAPTSSRSTFEADVMKMTEALKAVDATATKLDALMRELSSSDSMEVDGDEARPLKRRRVENTGPSYSQVKQLHHTVATYRERLDRLDNDVHAQYEDLKEYLTKEFEDKLIARENEPQVFPGLARLERSEGAIIKMDESLTEVATEMTSMLDQGNNMRLSVENTRSALVTAQSQISTVRIRCPARM